MPYLPVTPTSVGGVSIYFLERGRGRGERGGQNGILFVRFVIVASGVSRFGWIGVCFGWR